MSSHTDTTSWEERFDYNFPLLDPRIDNHATLVNMAINEMKEFISQEIQKAREEERRSMLFPFDGMKINIQYRNGKEVLQNQKIISIDQINNYKQEFKEIAQLEFKRLFEDLAYSLSHQSKEV